MRQKLPPLNALRVFEVASRAGSYTAAARELNLTHGAVSRQIAILEAWFGQPLFVRDGQSMVASPHARALAREISASFDHIADAAERHGKSRKVQIIRVSAPATVAMRWLIPRLSLFADLHPEVEVRVTTVLSTEPGFKGSFDVAIRRHVPGNGQFQAWPLFREANTVIASPALLHKQAIVSVEQLAGATWLTTETRPGDWERWLEAASQSGLRAQRSMRFDHFFVTLQAVADGLGFGIGPFPTLEADCASGRLQRPFPSMLAPGSTYYALVPLDADKPAYLRAFVDWLQSSVHASASDV
jgi:LysR family glycine cleavage system transcriptional activator